MREVANSLVNYKSFTWTASAGTNGTRNGDITIM